MHVYVDSRFIPWFYSGTKWYRRKLWKSQCRVKWERLIDVTANYTFNNCSFTTVRTLLSQDPNSTQTRSSWDSTHNDGHYRSQHCTYRLIVSLFSADVWCAKKICGDSPFDSCICSGRAHRYTIATRALVSKRRTVDVSRESFHHQVPAGVGISIRTTIIVTALAATERTVDTEWSGCRGIWNKSIAIRSGIARNLFHPCPVNGVQCSMYIGCIYTSSLRNTIGSWARSLVPKITYTLIDYAPSLINRVLQIVDMLHTTHNTQQTYWSLECAHACHRKVFFTIRRARGECYNKPQSLLWNGVEILNERYEGTRSYNVPTCRDRVAPWLGDARTWTTKSVWRGCTDIMHLGTIGVGYM